MKKDINILTIRNIIISLTVTILLIWVFMQNELYTKLITIPFLTCSISFLGENISLLLKKYKTANIFKYIFRISFFVYAFSFLTYATYYTLVNQEYSLLLLILIFLIFILYFLKKSFSRRK